MIRQNPCHGCGTRNARKQCTVNIDRHGKNTTKIIEEKCDEMKIENRISWRNHYYSTGLFLWSMRKRQTMLYIKVCGERISSFLQIKSRYDVQSEATDSLRCEKVVSWCAFDMFCHSAIHLHQMARAYLAFQHSNCQSIWLLNNKMPSSRFYIAFNVLKHFALYGVVSCLSHCFQIVYRFDVIYSFFSTFFKIDTHKTYRGRLLHCETVSLTQVVHRLLKTINRTIAICRSYFIHPLMMQSKCTNQQFEWSLVYANFHLACQNVCHFERDMQ